MNAPGTMPTDQSNAPDWVRHRGLRQWVAEIARLVSREEYVQELLGGHVGVGDDEQHGDGDHKALEGSESV